MNGYITFENITFIIALGGIAFGVFHFFHNPDVNADKRLCLLESLFKSERERNDILIETEKNHLHTLQVGQEKINKSITDVRIEVSKLGTILEERLPRKN
jgi:hypothetical protein